MGFAYRAWVSIPTNDGDQMILKAGSFIYFSGSTQPQGNVSDFRCRVFPFPLSFPMFFFPFPVFYDAFFWGGGSIPVHTEGEFWEPIFRVFFSRKIAFNFNVAKDNAPLSLPFSIAGSRHFPNISTFFKSFFSLFRPPPPRRW